MNLKLRRVLSFLMALIMVVQYVPATVLATEGDSLCEHHTEHTAECGYVEGESDCAYHCDACLGHEHDVASVTEPVTEATEASSEPSTLATEEVTEPSAEVTEEVTEPSTENTEPTAEPTEPETESVEIVISHHAAGQLYKDGYGYYMISTAQELQEFATLVNAGEFNAFGQLMADIDMSGVSNWLPIGMGYPYTGRFNGQGYSVKNLNISFQGEYSGLFGRTGNGAHIQNLSLENITIQAGGSFCGGLVGHNQGIVEKCSVAGQIVQYSQYTGGLIGLNQGQIGSCYAAVIGPNPVCGNHQGSAFGYIAYNYDLGNGGIGTPASTAQFTSGEVAYALGWGQDLDNGKTVQAYPSLKGAAVKKFTNCNGATIYSNLDSYMGHLFENGVCKYCGGNEGTIKNCAHSAKTYTDKGSSHAWYCAACHTSGTESHSYENGLCICGRVDPDAVASLSKNGTIVSGGTLAEIITQAQSCTAADKAVVKLLKDIDLGNVYQRILGGTFTIDLNGKTLTSAYDNYGALTLMSTASVTITGPGKIIGNYAGVEAIGGSQLVMNNVDCSAASNAVQIGGTGSSGEFTDCSITSGENAVSVFSMGPTIFRNCEITGQLYLQEASSNYPDVRVFGGSFPAGLKASFVLRTKLTLKLDENGHGPTVHGDINVEGSTLNAILDEGLAYWAGDTMLSVADKATSITGKGDITIKAACTHSGGTKGSYVNNDSNHSFTWSCCGLIVDEDHSYGNNGLCLCGAVNPDAVATLSKDSQVVFAATTLNAVIREARECAAGDKAVVQLLQDVPMGEKNQGISDGVFTLDLNGRTISNTAESLGAVIVSGSNTAVTIRNGTISGVNSAVEAYDGGKATLENMTLTALSSIRTGRDSVVILQDCVVTASFSGLSVGGGAVYVYDSVINGDSNDISFKSGSVVLREGASFPGGISVRGTTLNEILDEGLAYWAGDTMLSVADDAESITGKGDISVKAACTHENGTKGSYVYNDSNHSFSWSCCGLTVSEDHSFADGVCLCGYECAHQDAVYTINQDNTHTLSCGFCKVVITEDHKYDPTTAQCICGVQAVAQSTIGATVTYHLTLGEAIAAVSSAVESDKAVVKLLCDIDLGGSKQEISSGVFTLDLNGCALVNLAEDYVLSVTGGADLTIADSGTDGEIRSMRTGLNLVSGTLSITGGVIHGENNGVYSEGGTLMISGGSISGGTCGVYTLRTQMVTITGGTFSGSVGVDSSSDTLSISGGTFTGTECGLETYDRTAIISGGTFDGGSMGVHTVGSDAVTITGGIFSGDHALLSDSCDTVEITGGSFCGNTADLGFRSKMQFVLGLGEDGTGPIFPGGISLKTYAYSDPVAVNFTLLDILDEDLVYWKNGNPIFVSDDQTEISGGDVTVGELNCDHTGNTSEEYTDNGDETHSLLCSDCGFPIATEGHTMDANQPCICGVKPAVMTTIGENTCCYALLSSAVTAMADTTAEDKAVLKLLEDIDLGDSKQNIDSGVFTLDLNGKCLSGGMEYSGVINVNDANLTITDSGIGGIISGCDYGVCAFNQATITITGGIITGRIGAESNSSAEIIITGGSICGTERGVSVNRGFLYVRGGTVSSDEVALYAVRLSDMIISGGTISGGTCDIYVRDPENVDIWLTLSEEGAGPIFPGGLTVSGTTLSAILEEGAACWQHGERITVSADQTEIVGGDVYILPDCDHSGSTATEFTNNGDGTHSGICSVCGFPYTQPHTEDYTYLNLQEQGHKAYYPCCETTEDVEISEHGACKCVCGYLELMTLSFYAVKGDKTPVATFQVPYNTELIRWDYDEETGERIPVFSVYLENLLSQIDTTGLTREHYTFGGWDFGENRIMFDDIDICGAWNPVRYNITWDLAGGYAKDPDSLPTAAYYDSGIVLWTRILREGYVLSHFVDQNGVEYSMVWRSDHWSIEQGMPGHDIVLTAVWEEVHTCVHSEYKAISESEHQSFCQCGKPIGEPEPHDYQYDAEKHMCICGASDIVTIVTEPVSASGKLGETVTVSVKATGYDLQYQWYGLNAGTRKWFKSKITTDTYTVEMNGDRAGRALYCVITDGYGNSVQTETVRIEGIVETELKILNQPTDAAAKLGEGYYTEVIAEGDGLKYQWYFKNKKSEEFHKSSVRDNSYDDVMTKERNGRQIYCVVTDGWGNSLKTDTVTLTGIPGAKLIITKQPVDDSVMMGETYNVTVEAEGEDLTYQWYFKSRNHETFHRSGVKINAYTDVMTAERHDREIYCVITDALGNTVTSDTVTIRATQGKELTIVQQPQDAQAKMGERYCTEVIAEGEELKYQWYFRNAGKKTFFKSSVKDSTYDDVMTEERADREVYCVITDLFGNSIRTDTVALICTD